MAELAASGQHLQHVTNMREVKMVVLQFNAEHQPGWTSELVKQYELAMMERFQTFVVREKHF